MENILRDGVSMQRSCKIVIVGLHLKGHERALGNQTIFETVSKATLGKLPTDEAAESIYNYGLPHSVGYLFEVNTFNA